MLLQACVIALVALLSAYLSVPLPAKDDAQLLVSADQPNPIAQQHPELVSGTLNGTTLIVPIALAVARQVIPKEYGILEHVYRKLLPSFPQGMYPLVATAVRSHDIQFPIYNMSIPDFSRAVLEFPFLDILGDNTTSFRWSGTAMISASNPAAVEGAAGFGLKVYAAAFDPPANAYRVSSQGQTFFHAEMPSTAAAAASGGSAGPSMTVRTEPSPEEIPYPLDFLRTITNQPTFANNTSSCDRYVRLYNTTLTASPFSPVPVRGSVTAKVEPFADSTQTWTGIYGWRLATAFLEPPVPQSCESLRGFVDY